MQTLTPSSTITNSNWTVSSGTAHAALADDDTDTYVTCSNASNELEVKFSSPLQTPGVGHSRFRIVAKGPGNIAWRWLEDTTALETGTVYALASVYEEREVALTARPSAWTNLRIEMIASNGVVVYDVELNTSDGSRDSSDPKRKRGGKFFDTRKLWNVFRRR